MPARSASSSSCAWPKHPAGARWNGLGRSSLVPRILSVQPPRPCQVPEPVLVSHPITPAWAATRTVGRRGILVREQWLTLLSATAASGSSNDTRSKGPHSMSSSRFSSLARQLQQAIDCVPVARGRPLAELALEEGVVELAASVAVATVHVDGLLARWRVRGSTGTKLPTLFSPQSRTAPPLSTAQA